MIEQRQALPREEAAARAPRARAYAEAQRHSARVRWLRRVIPVGAVLGVVAVVGFAYFDPLGRLSGLSLGSIQLSGTKITMVSPRLTGQRSNARGYEISAAAAEQDVRKPGFVELRRMVGRIAMDDAGSNAHVEALAGVFDTAKEQLELSEKVHVRTDDGQEIWLKSASIDFKAGTVVSREEVKLALKNGTVEADSLLVVDNGLTISFVGRVRAVFEAPKEASGAGQAPVSAALPKGAGPTTAPPRAETEAKDGAARPLVLNPARSAKAESREVR